MGRVTCASTTATLSASTMINPHCFRPQLVANNLPYSNPSFIRSGFQYSHPLGSTPPSIVYTTPYSGPSHSSSSQSSFRIILLQLCSPLVCLCYDCSQALKPGGIISSPPHDLNEQTLERKYSRKNEDQGVERLLLLERSLCQKKAALLQCTNDNFV